MKKLILAGSLAAILASCSSSDTTQESTLKDHFKNDFLIGTAINMDIVNGLDPKADSIVSLHYNTVVAENCMKCEKIHPEENRYDWTDPDLFVKYGEDRNMAIIGHTLIWHSQLAPWFPVDSADNKVTPEVLKQRMKDHIYTVVGRYKGRILGWDVVNEAIEDDGSYRKSPFYEILGEEYIPLAFQYAHEADPDAELYINDYSMAKPSKRETYKKIIKDLKERGLRVDAIGMQSHNGMDYPNFEEYEKSIEEYGKCGVNVMITELDMNVLPTVFEGANISDKKEYEEALNPYKNGLPKDVSDKWNDRMSELFDMYKRHSDVISRVNWWGTHDGMSWLNDWPINGRTNYPLPFDRNYEMKPFLQKELASGNVSPTN